MRVPQVTGELVVVEGTVEIRRTELYQKIKAELSGMADESSAPIADREGLLKARETVKNLKALYESIREKFLEAENQALKSFDDITAMKNELLGLAQTVGDRLTIHLDSFEEAAARQAEEARKREEAITATQRNKAQRQNDLFSLQCEITLARQIADNSDRAGQSGTATEIRKGLERFSKLASSPGDFPSPDRDIKEVRKLVATALAREANLTE